MRTLKEYLETPRPHILNIGCGHNNKPESFGLDIRPFEGVDIVADLNQDIPLPDNAFDGVYAQDVLEHVDMHSRIRVMENIYRVLKPGGLLEFAVPSTDGCNRGAFCDPTHYSFWNEISFWYYLDDMHGKGFRALYDIQCWFIPLKLETSYNEWNITYVRGTLRKPE